MSEPRPLKCWYCGDGVMSLRVVRTVKQYHGIMLNREHDDARRTSDGNIEIGDPPYETSEDHDDDVPAVLLCVACGRESPLEVGYDIV